MTKAASTIILNAQTALHDEDGVRWPAAELVRYLNLGQDAIAEIRPDQKRGTIQIPLAEGYEQALPGTATALIDIPSNATGRKSRITKVDLQLLDHMVPEWRSMPTALQVKHFMHNMAEPRKFDVYPPVQAGVPVFATVGLYPTPIPTPTGPTSIGVIGNIDLPDYWESALLDYVLFRAYSKDAEFGGNVAMAKSYHDLFMGAMGLQLQSTEGVAPKS
jgi:hypothetical protein